MEIKAFLDIIYIDSNNTPERWGFFSSASNITVWSENMGSVRQHKKYIILAWPYLTHLAQDKKLIILYVFTVENTVRMWIKVKMYKATFYEEVLGRRCCLGDVLERHNNHLAARMICTKVFGRTSILTGWWFGMVWTRWSNLFFLSIHFAK